MNTNEIKTDAQTEINTDVQAEETKSNEPKFLKVKAKVKAGAWRRY